MRRMRRQATKAKRGGCLRVPQDAEPKAYVALVSCRNVSNTRKEGSCLCVVGNELRGRRMVDGVPPRGSSALSDVEGTHDKRYTGLIIHDLRRSATRNLIAAGVSEKVAMTILGHETREIFDRSHIVDSADVRNAMRRVENNQGQKSLVPVSVKKCSLRRIPDAAQVLDFSTCWEVVQSVGHQTLDLIILVRVQASQPMLSVNFSSAVRSQSGSGSAPRRPARTRGSESSQAHLFCLRRG